MSRTLFTLVLLGLVINSMGHFMENFPHPDYGLHHHGFDHGVDYSSYEDFDHLHHGYVHDHHNYKEASRSVKIINKIQRKYSIAKSFLHKFCKQNTNIGAKIFYGTDAFIIKYPLPNVNNLNITVKAVNGLVRTEVKEQDHFKGFQDIRILPDMLDLQNGFWSIEQSNLKILLPYKVSSAELNTVCEADDNEVYIPGNITPLFTVRFGKNNP